MRTDHFTDDLAEARGLLGGLASAAVLLTLGAMLGLALFGN